MKSSDQRYFQVRRPKSQTNHYVELAKALRDARHDPLKVIEVDKLVAASTTDFTHVMLVCGRTAKDFRRNFRRGCAEFNTVTAVQLVPYETLLKAELDGYSLLRLTKEQHWNVKQRWAKLREQDALLHDPQGAFWTRVLRALLDGRHDGHLSILTDIRDKGQRLVAQNVATAPLGERLREHKEHKREIKAKARAGLLPVVPHPDNGQADLIAADPERAARGAARMAWLYMNEPWRAPTANEAQIRVRLERALVLAETYLDGGDILLAAYDPDTSERHCSNARLQARLARVVRGMAEQQQSTLSGISPL